MKGWVPGLVLLVLAILFFLIARSKEKASGLPKGKITYADNSVWQKVPSPLYDAILNLVGKPDYVVRLKNGDLIPVEVKSGKGVRDPYESYKIQLAAYCHLLEKNYGKRPPYGLIHYDDKNFRIDYSPTLENEFLSIVSDIQAIEQYGDMPARSHSQASRCKACGYQNRCEERLA